MPFGDVVPKDLYPVLLSVLLYNMLTMKIMSYLCGMPTQKPKRKMSPRPPSRNFYPPKYKTYMDRAEGRGMPFDLMCDEFVELMRGTCVYCGGPGGTVDRIDNALGYTKDNTCPCCWPCNWMKKHLSVEEFKEHITKIYNKLILSQV